MAHPNYLPETLSELLYLRASQEPRRVHFLDNAGNVESTLSYRDLYIYAMAIAKKLLGCGLAGDGSDIVVANFNNQRSHILTFWGCCLAGIPISPTPPLHPEPSKQVLFLHHLQTLFHQPVFVSETAVLDTVKHHVPEARTLLIDDLISSLSDVSLDGDLPLPPPQSRSDTVAIMLTSGSTGNSKGVVLPHFTLLSSVQGKAKKHATTTESCFLNWINFDHVANVTEAHLQAIWAGASQYQVSPSAIISRPTNLLDWCSRYKVTNTFSPNFLLAQICRDAESTVTSPIDLSSLRVFITGGEANPVKTAVEFSDLLGKFGAPRTTLRAGFGMTETCAGSIYLMDEVLKTVPDYGSMVYLPLGTPNHTINMRIVDGDSLDPCVAGTIGQLQVSGDCIFPRYYANPSATASSFTSDGWFATGDLGFIDESGNLVMVGRSKDDININGVKFPSTDIEHHIGDSGIDGVENSFIFASAVRAAGASTESYAIFYRHSNVEIEQLAREEAPAGKDLQQLLTTNRLIKNACIVFCAQSPLIILPLPSTCFVKTALGKVSRSALRSAYEQGKFKQFEDLLKTAADTPTSGSNIDSEISPVAQILIDGVAEVFEVDKSTLKLDQNVFDIGASSMHLVRLKQFIQDRCGVPDLPTIELLKRPILSDLESYIHEVQDRGKTVAPYNPLVCFQPLGSKPPLYLVHPGVGEVLIFINLARVLNDDRPVYALRARGFEAGESPPGSLQEMADDYAEAIEKNNPDGPYLIAGYSFGAAIAVEIAKKLEKKGKNVQWVGILNLPPHIQFRIKELIWIETLLNLCMFLALIGQDDFMPMKARLLEQFPLAGSDSEPENSVEVVKWVLANSDHGRFEELHMSFEAFHRWVNIAYCVSSSGSTYEPSGAVQNALTSVFCAIPLPSMGTRESYKRERLSQWKDFSGPNFEMLDIDGEHYTMLAEEHCESFAAHMRGALQRAESLQKRGDDITMHKKNFTEVPIIDFSLSETDPTEYLRQLSFALEDVGFGIFINVPGLDQGFQDEVFAGARALFGKPEAWKRKLSTENSPSLRGYFRADEVGGHHKAFAEAYRFGAEREARPDSDPFWLRLHEGPNQWPDDSELPGFRATIELLFQRYYDLNLKLNKHIAQLLDVTDDVIEDYFPNPIEFNAGFWHYFPLSAESKATAKDGFVQGMHEHRDPSTFLTCLIQSRPGLEVQNHTGDWIEIPMVEGGVVCNIGMQFMRLTGGKLVATTHRVNTLKIDEDRYTIPYVLTTKLEKPIHPLPKFATADMAKLHVAPNKKILALGAIEDPLLRSGYARLSLMPGAAKKWYPEAWEEAERLGIV